MNKTTILILSTLAASALFAQPACPGFPNCLYTAGPTYTITRTTLRITYEDIAARKRTIEVTVRVPNRSGPLPVMIWGHGGGDGRNNVGGSVGALEQWSQFTASVGYLTVSPAFHVRTDEDQLALCKRLGVPEGDECESFSSLSWDRPYDVRAIIDELVEQNSAGPFKGRIDLDKIGVGGHSAGSSGTLSVAGAAREMAGKRYGPEYFADRRPKAFVALSPSAPGHSYMFDTKFNDASTSWDTVRGPVLMATGSGDAHEQFGQGRRVPFEYVPPGDKYRLFIHDEDFSHEAFGDGLDDCGGIPERKCDAFRAMLTSLVHAFLDGYVERKPRALDYLKGDHVKQLAPDLLEWSRK